MKTICEYCDLTFEERDIEICDDCLAEGCSFCIEARRCCNGYGFEEYPEDEFIDQEDYTDEEDDYEEE